ncbi:chaperonin 10-like protein [Penicillium angulare]|uniref:chaperonin 10-like protein n=1 Tax=Penicillium angulare TaxID=116970 RepID=UPI00253FC565|nr:chaperonin 10-like protein [Penicillium angulare]KAJ5263936.1 chaperonin 10-like protein [Penicillium angulare]
MECWFCKHGYTNRCQNGPSFGSMALDGGQAEYVRIPFADSTLETIPEDVDDDLMMLMCDIFPTGYYGTMKALTKLMQNTETAETIFNFKPVPSAPKLYYTRQELKDVTVVCLGCGPVGICGVLTAVALGAGTVYAVDSVPDRLEQARNMGAIPLTLGVDDIVSIIKAATDGRGADAVVENVGNRAAMRLAFDLVRACGVISSIGFHQSDLPFDAFEAYSKNIDLNMGRAAVRPVFGEALRILTEHQDKLSSFISHKMPLREAPAAYDMFEKHQARKVLFTL